MEEIEKIQYLISFLMIIVDRNNGKLEIRNLSEYAGKNMHVVFDPDFDNDMVTLRTVTVDGRKTH